MISNGDDRSEIAFFDVETTIPTRPGQGFSILEFGAILVCPKKLIELENYSTLIHPADLSHISNLSVRCNGISKEAVSSAPKFADIADKVFDILHGRIWAGHNILRFDCARIREAFSEINRLPPEPKGTIDSLALLTQRFGRRAGDMKMASLASYFGLGQQTHRSLDDVRMNLEVLKYCATVLFLESSLPEIFTEKSWVSPNAITRSRSHGKASSPGMETSPSNQNLLLSSSSSSVNQRIEENHPILSLVTPNTGEEETTSRVDPFDMSQLGEEMESESHHSSDPTREESSSSVSDSLISNSYLINFVKPDEISMDSIRANLVPFYRGIQRIQILHRDIPLQMCFENLKVRFGVSARFLDYAGRPRLNFMVDADPKLCCILDACDGMVQKLLMESGGNSEWRNVVMRKPGFFNNPTIRLHIPNEPDGEGGNGVRWLTEIYTKEESSSRGVGKTKRVVFSRFEITEIDSLLTPGTLVDAYCSLEPYDYQQNAGIRLVAKKLIILRSN